MREDEQRPTEPERRGPQVEIVGHPSAISKRLDRLAESAAGWDPAQRATLSAALERMTGGVAEQVRRLQDTPSFKALADSESALRRLGSMPMPRPVLDVGRIRRPASSDDIEALKDALVALHEVAVLQAERDVERDRERDEREDARGRRMLWLTVVTTIVAVATLLDILLR